FGDNGYKVSQVFKNFNSLVESSNQAINFTNQLSANYNRSIGNHNIGALLLLETLETSGSGVDVSGNILTTSVPYLSTVDPKSLTVNSNASEYGRVGLVGRLNYNYKEKYLV